MYLEILERETYLTNGFTPGDKSKAIITLINLKCTSGHHSGFKMILNIVKGFRERKYCNLKCQMSRAYLDRANYVNQLSYLRASTNWFLF